eukprot:6214816-Pleurochrysis_carterae.AAC.1
MPTPCPRTHAPPRMHASIPVHASCYLRVFDQGLLGECYAGNGDDNRTASSRHLDVKDVAAAMIRPAQVGNHFGGEAHGSGDGGSGDHGSGDDGSGEHGSGDDASGDHGSGASGEFDEDSPAETVGKPSLAPPPKPPFVPLLPKKLLPPAPCVEQ